MSDSGKSSKFDVSSMLLISMEMAAGRSLWRQDREDHGQKRTEIRSIKYPTYTLLASCMCLSYRFCHSDILMHLYSDGTFTEGAMCMREEQWSPVVTLKS